MGLAIDLARVAEQMAIEADEPIGAKAKAASKRITNAKEVDSFGPGGYGVKDTPNLILRVKAGSKPGSSTRSWVYRCSYKGKVKEVGIGKAGKHGLGLADAKAKAGDVRKWVLDGNDPSLFNKQGETGPAITFKQYAEDYIKTKELEFSNGKHFKQWGSTLTQYVYDFKKGGSKIGSKTPAQITYDDIEALLNQPSLTADKGPNVGKYKYETASRICQRMTAILDYAAIKEKEPARHNPARFYKVKRPRGQGVRNHPACPVRAASAFYTALRHNEAVSTQGKGAARLLRFAILCASRSSEVRGARWDEIRGDTWVIPKERMKARVKHMVPLSKEALAIIDAQAAKRIGDQPLIFPGVKGGTISDVAVNKIIDRLYKPMPADPNELEEIPQSITAHGFRSTFRDWVADETNYPREIAEAALAHGLEDKTEAAYQRSSYFEKRKPMMQAWADFLDGGASGKDIDEEAADTVDGLKEMLARKLAEIDEITAAYAKLKATAEKEGWADYPSATG